VDVGATSGVADTLYAAPPGFIDLHSTRERATRRIYDVLSGVYAASTFLFHSRAHREAVRISGVRDGMRVLEVATGSGEMFRRLVRANPNGQTVGVDLSPRMAARTQRSVGRAFPMAATSCEAVDARYLPFRDRTIDVVICCYLLELLSGDDIVLTLREVRRVLRRGGGLTLILVGQRTEPFNRLYKLVGNLAPALWGRQVAERIPGVLERLDFRITDDYTVRQIGYPSRLLTARSA
jgi:ubiquinone/menaquinone biosynthesis C-methylase UbiE